MPAFPNSGGGSLGGCFLSLLVGVNARARVPLPRVPGRRLLLRALFLLVRAGASWGGSGAGGPSCWGVPGV
jgi:hypothetical protein